MPRVLALLLAALLVVVTVLAQEPNPNIRFGLPAPAKADPESREAFLIARPQYVLSYNAKTRTPNWVSWRLRESDIGNTPRSAFELDPALPLGVIAWVTAHDYGNSGFHKYANLENDSFRTLLLNAVAWTAKLEVPAKGVPSQTPTAKDLEKLVEEAVRVGNP
jgi:hypothetical protein